MQEIILVIVSIFVWTRVKDYLEEKEEDRKDESKESMLLQAVENNKQSIISLVPEDKKAETKVLLSHLEINAREMYKVVDKDSQSLGEKIGGFIGDIRKGARK